MELNGNAEKLVALLVRDADSSILQNIHDRVVSYVFESADKVTDMCCCRSC